MDASQTLLVLLIGTVNPAIVEYCIKVFFIYRGERKYSDEELHVIKSGIRTLVIGFVGGIVTYMLLRSGAFSDIFDMAITFITFILASQGSYDLIYKPIKSGPKKY